MLESARWVDGLPGYTDEMFGLLLEALGEWGLKVRGPNGRAWRTDGIPSTCYPFGWHDCRVLASSRTKSNFRFIPDRKPGRGLFFSYLLEVDDRRERERDGVNFVLRLPERLVDRDSYLLVVAADEMPRFWGGH